MLELYCGIGGASLALQGSAWSVALAVDIDQQAIEAYRRNFPAHAVRTAELASFPVGDIAVDGWWLSPPCLPFTRKGNQADLEDARNASLLALIQQLNPTTASPRWLALENVPPFAESRTCQWLLQRLQALDYETALELRCPTELGWPMRRQRCYVLASRDGLRPLSHATVCPWSRLGACLDPAPHDDSWDVPQTLLDAYAPAIDVVDPDDPAAVAACFTSSYGRSPVRSGSYLRHSTGKVRYFTPSEILRLLGFPPEFQLPENMSRRAAWKLAGNSVSVPVVRWMLGRLPARR